MGDDYHMYGRRTLTGEQFAQELLLTVDQFALNLVIYISMFLVTSQIKRIIDNNSDYYFVQEPRFLVKNCGSHAFFVLTYINRYFIYGQPLESSCCLVDSESEDEVVMRER